MLVYIPFVYSIPLGSARAQQSQGAGHDRMALHDLHRVAHLTVLLVVRLEARGLVHHLAIQRVLDAVVRLRAARLSSAQPSGSPMQAENK